jgi:hypothetical protein
MTKVLAASFALPLALYAILRPENYGLTPNSLDPLFYSGYAINFDDIMNAVGDRHYFVSRWSAYYPGYVADQIAGPFVGRLLLRLVYAAVILISVWHLGSRLRWTKAQQLLMGTLILTMPMFVRSFFTDYTEYVIVALGLCLVVLCLLERQTWRSAIVIGALAGLMVVANPVAITAVGFPVAASLLLGAKRLRDKAFVAAFIGVGVSMTVLGGLLLFRWRYGIDNVYQPTLDFIRTHNVRDGFKSPRLEWLWHYTWLWATPSLLLVAIGSARRRAVRLSRPEIYALGLCALQYVYQWIDQFVRDGDGLEVSYYWSYSLPTFLVALAIVLGRLTAGTAPLKIVAATAAWLIFLLVGVPDFARLPAGVGFFICALAMVTVVVLACGRYPFAAAMIVLFAVGWMQIGAPHYDPSSYFLLNTTPRYDQLYRRAGDLNETIYREAVWFEDEMDNIVNDASTSFVAVGQWSISIIGLYAPHVVGRVVGLEGAPLHRRLTPLAIAEIRGGGRPIVAAYGPPADVAAVLATFPTDLGVGEKILDVTHDDDLGYRLVVYSMPDSGKLPFTWTADVLPLAAGSVVGTDVRVDKDDTPGFVTYGPYVPLQRGHYELVLSYTSTLPTSESAGTFDVASPELGNAGQTAIEGSGGGPATARLRFDVMDGSGRWEFRTLWNGLGELTIHSITLSAT